VFQRTGIDVNKSVSLLAGIILHANVGPKSVDYITGTSDKPLEEVSLVERFSLFLRTPSTQAP
jgi:hypothetical protein